MPGTGRSESHRAASKIDGADPTQFGKQGQHRNPGCGEEVALDPIDELDPLSVDPAEIGALQPIRADLRHVTADKAGIELQQCDARDTSMAPQHLAIPGQHDGHMDLVRLAGKQEKAASCFLHVRRHMQDLVIQREDLFATEEEEAWLPSACLRRLGLRQNEGDIFG